MGLLSYGECSNTDGNISQKKVQWQFHIRLERILYHLSAVKSQSDATHASYLLLDARLYLILCGSSGRSARVAERERNRLNGAKTNNRRVDTASITVLWEY